MKDVAERRGGALFVMGDWNWVAGGDVQTRLKKSGEVEHNPRSSSEQRAWRHVLGDLTELDQPDPTRAGTRETGDNDFEIVTAKLDRIYTSLPPWVLTKLQVKAKLFCPALLARERVRSDHAPIQCAIASKTMMQKTARPTPRFGLPSITSSRPH